MLRQPSRRLFAVVGVLVLSSAVLSGALLSSSSAQDSNAQVRLHFQAAQQDQQQGLLDAAAHEYQEVLRLEPELPEAYVNLGLVYYLQSKFEASAEALAAAGKLRPGMHGVNLWLGIDDVKLRRPAEGAVLLRQAVRIDPTDKQAQTWLGTALWDAGQVDAALLQLSKTARQFPDDPDVLQACGEAYAKASSQMTEQLLEESAGTALSDLIYANIYTADGEWAKAEGHLHRAIERDPHLLDARLALAQVFFEQNKLTAAQDELNQALAEAPRSATALARSGELMLLAGGGDDGLARIQAAFAIDSSETLDSLGLPAEDRFDGSVEADAQLQLSLKQTARSLEAEPTANAARNIALSALYAQAGDEQASQRWFGKLDPIHATPNPSASVLTRAMNAAHQHHFDDAQAGLLRWLAANPTDRMARYRLSLVRRQISMAQLARLVVVAPDSYHVHEMLAQIYARREEDDKALAEYLAVVAADPNLPDVHFWLGHLYWKHGDADHALTELNRELELDPGHPEANGELGAILASQEHPAEAIPHLEAAIHSKPDLWPAYQQLGKAYASEKNYARAEQVLTRALAHDSDGGMHYQLGLVLRAEGKTDQAAQIFAQVRAIKLEQMTVLSTGDSNPGEAKP
jgi:tetratricopeptide (TPR) repeat protein